MRIINSFAEKKVALYFCWQKIGRGNTGGFVICPANNLYRQLYIHLVLFLFVSVCVFFIKFSKKFFDSKIKKFFNLSSTKMITFQLQYLML